MALYFNNFKGTAKIEATQENGPGYFANYATLWNTTYTRNFTGIVYVNFYGVWSHVRVVHSPEKDINNMNFYSPGSQHNPTPTSSYYPNGKIDKLLYRS
jgi:hypothetical protein